VLPAQTPVVVAVSRFQPLTCPSCDAVSRFQPLTALGVEISTSALRSFALRHCLTRIPELAESRMGPCCRTTSSWRRVPMYNHSLCRVCRTTIVSVPCVSVLCLACVRACCVCLSACRCVVHVLRACRSCMSRACGAMRPVVGWPMCGWCPALLPTGLSRACWPRRSSSRTTFAALPRCQRRSAWCARL